MAKLPKDQAAKEITDRIAVMQIEVTRLQGEKSDADKKARKIGKEIDALRDELISVLTS